MTDSEDASADRRGEGSDPRGKGAASERRNPPPAVVPDPIDAESIRRGLPNRWLGRRLFTLDVTASTSDVAWRLAEAGLPDGTAIFADQQVRGRGSRGRTWHSTPGRSLLLSIVSRFELPPDRTAALTSVTAIAVARALNEQAGFRPHIVWPNDLYHDGKKLGGILVETRSPSRIGPVHIVGIGLNVHPLGPELPDELTDRAGSVDEAAGRRVGRVPLARSLLTALETDLDRLRSGHLASLRADLQSASGLLGRRARFVIAGAIREARVISVELDGRLQLDEEDGRTVVRRPEELRLYSIADDEAGWFVVRPQDEPDPPTPGRHDSQPARDH